MSGLLQVLPDGKPMLSRGLHGIEPRPGVFGIWPVRGQSRGQVLNTFGERNTLADNMFPTIVPAFVSELLLSLSVRGHTAEEADKSSMGKMYR